MHFKRVAGSIGGAIVVVILVSMIAFGLSALSPTDAATHSFTSMGIAPTEDQLAAKRAELGLDKPAMVQYMDWISGVIQGDFGTSYRNGAPVADVIFGALPYTLLLSLTSMILTLVIAIPVGLLCARKRDGVFDRIFQAITYFFNAMPSFFIAILLLYVLSVQLKVVSVMSTRGFAGVILPTLALALPLSAWFARQVRAYALEQLGKPYIEGLRSRGVSEKAILWKHVLRNIALPLMTLIGIACGMLLGGSAIVESIFNWPGLGYESIEAVGHRDYPIIGAYALIMAVVYLIVNGLVDLSYRFFDPRKQQSAGGESNA